LQRVRATDVGADAFTHDTALHAARARFFVSSFLPRAIPPQSTHTYPVRNIAPVAQATTSIAHHPPTATTRCVPYHTMSSTTTTMTDHMSTCAQGPAPPLPLLHRHAISHPPRARRSKQPRASIQAVQARPAAAPAQLAQRRRGPPGPAGARHAGERKAQRERE
jgi:hypothetical protein